MRQSRPVPDKCGVSCANACFRCIMLCAMCVILGVYYTKHSAQNYVLVSVYDTVKYTGSGLSAWTARAHVRRNLNAFLEQPGCNICIQIHRTGFRFIATRFSHKSCDSFGCGTQYHQQQQKTHPCVSLSPLKHTLTPSGSLHVFYKFALYAQTVCARGLTLISFAYMYIYKCMCDVCLSHPAAGSAVVTKLRAYISLRFLYALARDTRKRPTHTFHI